MKTNYYIERGMRVCREEYRQDDGSWGPRPAPLRRIDKLVLTLLALVITFAICGCDTYKKTGWYAPDGMNYTVSRDRRDGDLTDYFGLTWSLK